MNRIDTIYESATILILKQIFFYYEINCKTA